MRDRKVAPRGESRVRSRRRVAVEVVAASLLVTALAVVVGVAAALATDARWSYVFVITRWCFVGVLLATPLAHQALARYQPARGRLPFVLRTPLTALVLTAEGIAYDIASARLG